MDVIQSKLKNFPEQIKNIQERENHLLELLEGSSEEVDDIQDKENQSE